MTVPGWTPSQTIVEREYVGTGSSKTTVATDGAYVLLGLPNSRLRGVFSGAVYAYTPTLTDGWVQDSVLVPIVSGPYSLFGVSMATSESLVAVSAEERDRSGTVYVYSRFANGWSFPSRIVRRIL